MIRHGFITKEPVAMQGFHGFLFVEAPTADGLPFGCKGERCAVQLADVRPTVSIAGHAFPLVVDRRVPPGMVMMVRTEEETRELQDIVLNLTGEYPTTAGQYRMAQRIKELEAKLVLGPLAP